MKQQFQEIREKQKAAWNQFSTGWRKWDVEIRAHMQPATDEIIRLLKPKGAQLILDIAAGTGEPGLSIASMLTDGKVMITDLADDMLTIAREKAAKMDITNVEFRACDVCALPFADNTFDAVSCRMGFMFFPDMGLAATEILRVLKPGGRFATSVWSTPDKNFWASAIGDTINKNIQLPVSSPGATGIFRCATKGLMTTIFSQAGFKNITEKEVSCPLFCETVDTYWQLMTEIAAPVVAALNKADDALKATIKKEVYELVNHKFPGEHVIMDGSALVIYGEKESLSG